MYHTGSKNWENTRHQPTLSSGKTVQFNISSMSGVTIFFPGLGRVMRSCENFSLTFLLSQKKSPKSVLFWNLYICRIGIASCFCPAKPFLVRSDIFIFFSLFFGFFFPGCHWKLRVVRVQPRKLVRVVGIGRTKRIEEETLWRRGSSVAIAVFMMAWVIKQVRW